MYFRCTILAAALATLAGCSGSGESAKNFPAVTGTVSMDGAPLSGATVTFLPTGSGQGGTGRTDDAGKYTLKGLRGGGQGVAAGDYKVTISRWVLKDGTVPPATVDIASSGAKESLPAAYTDAPRTTLKATVGASGGNFDFALKSR